MSSKPKGDPSQILVYEDRTEIVRGNQHITIGCPGAPEPVGRARLTGKMETILAKATAAWVTRKELIESAGEEPDARAYEAVRELVALGKLEAQGRRKVRRAAL